MIAWRWDVPEDHRQRHLDLTLSFAVGAPGTGLHCWLAYIDGKPVSKVLLHLDSGVAGIHGVATKPEFRGKGIARGLVLLALHHARQAGYRVSMLHSSSMARSLYEKMGYREACEFRVYLFGGALHI